MKIVWNQNGVSYPASEPQKWNKINKDYKKRIHKADYVIYQSLFCKSSADEFLGVFEGPQSIIYNCVDTGFFTPSKNPDISRPLTLLLGGNQYRKYRLETALYTIAKIKQEIPDVRLIVTGTVAWDGKRKDSCMKEVQQVIQHLGITKNVEFTGKYSQKDAPDLYSRADILLHTKWRDPCPGLVIEAMSCGLPIIYSKSGGLPELVADDAGIGIPAKGDWDSIDPPDPELLCNAVLQVAQKLDWYSQNARRLAVTKFDLKDFISSHEKIFKEILEL
ncbi:MAG: glycosyltransferase family 4 protein [Methanospirillaceae archaeon]|nr:glycosyltransferase family 4 protein [Methanospirillaceae archaeon]